MVEILDYRIIFYLTTNNKNFGGWFVVESFSRERGPKVSIIVPIYNRCEFVAQLMSSIKSQTFTDYELIIVDDGSTDGVKEKLDAAAGSIDYTYIYQKNRGHYAARNLALSRTRGRYIAFHDSDDEWPDYHLEEFVEILDEHSDIDWVFGSIKRIDHKTGGTLAESNYYEKGGLHPFFQLKTVDRGSAKLVKDGNITCISIMHNVPGSTQCALIRAKVFKDNYFDESFRTAYDRFFAIKCTKLGFGFAFVDKVHQIYHVHDGHISLVSGYTPEKLEASAKTMLRGYDQIGELNLTDDERKNLSHKIASIYAWQLSISYRKRTMYREELLAMIEAFKIRPAKYLKPVLSSFIRYSVSIGSGRKGLDSR
ncbi:Glycosyl transferase family 2 [Marinobacter segnicrescens]|uniref:Glycosyl transferase family 2 n=1 Tax=Marinobacter segnicrescens TaxID=430453 RepID=A0A1I0H0E2_9GAMM|nr:glycosyltransferase family 2 protein [Marinobacter segnicrescens]SET76981.1 Glycosyl transferase family 2 [Marinobacter segnicrescens]